MRHSTAKKLTLLAYFAFWDRFIYYGAFTMLVLYLTEALHFSDFVTYSIWGVFAILGYSLPVLGGIIGDRWLSREQCIAYGALGSALGSVVLLCLKGPGFFLGVSCLLIGMGLLKANLATIVGQLSTDPSKEKSSHYNFYFIGMVLGATMGPAVFGFCAKYHWWYSGFLVSGLGALSIYTLSRLMLKHHKHIKQSLIQRVRQLAVFALAAFLLTTLFHYSEDGQLILGLFIALVVVYLVWTCFKTAPSERKKIAYIVILSLFCLPHFLGALQVDGSFSLFIQNDLNHNLMDWKIPTLEFSAIEPLFGAFFAPLVALFWLRLERKGRANIKPNWKLMIGSACSMMAFGLMTWLSSNALLAHSHFAIWAVAGANILIGMGDVLIIPTMMSAVSFYAPQNLKGTLMGFWFMSDALSGLFASLLAKSTEPQGTHHPSLMSFHHAFSDTGLILIGSIILLLLITPAFKYLLR